MNTIIHGLSWGLFWGGVGILVWMRRGWRR